MYYRDKRRVANTAERASETARQEPGLTRRFNDNTRMHYKYVIFIYKIMIHVEPCHDDCRRRHRFLYSPHG